MYFRIAFGLVAFLPLRSLVSAHGYMTVPRSRNTVAEQDGATWGSSRGVPGKEYCAHCLNRKSSNEQCGVSEQGPNYSTWLDITGSPMPWMSQAVYREGQEITVEAIMKTNHGG